MATGNLVIDPTFIAPQDWYNGGPSWPTGVITENSEIVVMAYGAMTLQFYPPTGSEIVVGAGQINVGDTLAFSGYMYPETAVGSGSPYFGLLDHNASLLASAIPLGPSHPTPGLASGTYVVAAGVVSIRPVFSLNGVTFVEANPGRSAWAASHAYAANAQVDPGNGFLYQAIVAGTSGSSQPTWPTPAGLVPTPTQPIPPGWVSITTTGTTNAGYNWLTSVGSTTGVEIGWVAIGAGIPNNATVIGIVGSTVYLSALCTSDSSGEVVTFAPLTVVTDGGVTWSCVAWQGRTMMLGAPYIAVL
jgi:hypothetical protein